MGRRQCLPLNGRFQLLDLIITELVTWPVKNSRSLIGGNFICQKNPLQDLLSSLNAVVSTNERHWIITGHVTFKLRYIFVNLVTENPQYCIKLKGKHCQKPHWGWGCRSLGAEAQLHPWHTWPLSYLAQLDHYTIRNGIEILEYFRYSYALLQENKKNADIFGAIFCFNEDVRLYVTIPG